MYLRPPFFKDSQQNNSRPQLQDTESEDETPDGESKDNGQTAIMRVRRTKPDNEVNLRIKVLSEKLKTEATLPKKEEEELKRLKSLMASRIHRDKKADEKLVNDGKLNQSERNETMVRALHETIDSLREQVKQGLVREEDWKKREVKWYEREEMWHDERKSLLTLIKMKSEDLDDNSHQDNMSGGVNAKRQAKAAEKAEVMLQRAEVNTAEDLDAGFELKTNLNTH